MMTLSTCGAGKARNYYQQDDYYSRDITAQDKFYGKNLTAFGLKNGEQLTAEKFQTITELVKAQGRENVAFDCTFSAPKSVSLAVYFADEKTKKEILQAHEKAVNDTLAKIEKGISYRDQRAGKTKNIRTGKMAAAKFNHSWSRAEDADLHTHCLIFNSTGKNGKDFAVDGKQFFQNQKLYGQEYRTALAAELQKRGLKIEVTDPEKGFFELSGVPREMLREFSKRRAQIEEQMEKDMTTGARAAEVANKKTRVAKNHQIDEQARAREIKTAAKEYGVKLEKVAARDLNAERSRAYAEAKNLIADQNFAFTRQNLKTAVMAHGVGCGLTEREAERLIAQDKTLIDLGKTTTGDGPAYLTTKRNLQVEYAIEKNALDGRGKGTGLTAEQVEKRIASAEQSRSTAERKFALTAEQHKAVVDVATSKDNVIAVVGLPGTGKTATMDVLREVLEGEGYEVRGMAASGAAADELSKDANIKECSTIQHMLNEAEKRAGNRNPQENFETKNSWNFEGIEKRSKGVIILDEASLTDNNALNGVLSMTAKTGEKVVLVGDPKQLLPVGAGNGFSNLVQDQKIQTNYLEDIQRQKNPELLQTVREIALNEKNGIKNSLNQLTADDKIHEISSRKRRLTAISKEFLSLTPEEQSKTLVISATNRDCQLLNAKIREGLIKSGQLQPGKEINIQMGKQKETTREFSTGDKIVFGKNDNNLSVKNGTQARIIGLDGDKMTVRTIAEEPQELTIDTSKYNHFDHAYCVTTHKSQGKTVDRVIVNLDSADKSLNTRNGYFVDVSRAKYQCDVFTDSRVKIEPQINQYAKKLTAKDFAPAKLERAQQLIKEQAPPEKSRFPELMKSLSKNINSFFDRYIGKERDSPAKEQTQTKETQTKDAPAAEIGGRGR